MAIFWYSTPPTKFPALSAPSQDPFVTGPAPPQVLSPYASRESKTDEEAPIPQLRAFDHQPTVSRGGPDQSDRLRAKVSVRQRVSPVPPPVVPPVAKKESVWDRLGTKKQRPLIKYEEEDPVDEMTRIKSRKRKKEV